MFLINYLFSSSVTFRRDYFIQFNRIAILALQYSITLHVISLLMCSGYISKDWGKFIHLGLLSNIKQIFQFLFFFISIFVLQFLCFSAAKVLIYKIDFNIFL